MPVAAASPHSHPALVVCLSRHLLACRSLHPAVSHSLRSLACRHRAHKDFPVGLRHPVLLVSLPRLAAPRVSRVILDVRIVLGVIQGQPTNELDRATILFLPPHGPMPPHRQFTMHMSVQARHQKHG